MTDTQTPIRGWRAKLRRHSAAVWFAGSNVISGATAMTCQFVALRFVPPEQMGIWLAALVLETYLLVSNLGVLNAMNREFPFFMSRGEHERAMRVAQTAQAHTLCMGALSGIVFSVLAIVYAATRGWQWSVVFSTAAVVAALRVYTGYLAATFRSGGEFGRIASFALVLVPLNVVALLLPWRFGLAGFCAAQLLLVLASALLHFYYRPVRAMPRFDWPTFKLLLSAGWRLHLVTYCANVGKSLPRVALVSLGGAHLLGLYAPVQAMIGGFDNIVGSVRAYLYPILTRQHARGRTDVGRSSLKAAGLMMGGMAPVVVVGWFVAAWAIPAFLPKYASATTAVQLGLLVGWFNCAKSAVPAFAVTKAWRPMFTNQALALAFQAAGAFGGYWLFEDRLLGVVTGALAAAVASSAVLLVLVRHVARTGEAVAPLDADSLSVASADRPPPAGAPAL